MMNKEDTKFKVSPLPPCRLDQKRNNFSSRNEKIITVTSIFDRKLCNKLDKWEKCVTVFFMLLSGQRELVQVLVRFSRGKRPTIIDLPVTSVTCTLATFGRQVKIQRHLRQNRSELMKKPRREHTTDRCKNVLIIAIVACEAPLVQRCFLNNFKTTNSGRNFAKKPTRTHSRPSTARNCRQNAKERVGVRRNGKLQNKFHHETTCKFYIVHMRIVRTDRTWK